MAPLANNPIMLGTFIWSFRHLEHQYLSSNGQDNWLVPFLATREAVALLVNDPIMSGRLIWSFRHLEHQNPSIISDSIGICRWLQKTSEEQEQEQEQEQEEILFI